MSTFISGGNIAEVDPENEAQFEAAGWSRVPEPSKPEKAPKPSDE